jgi:hypothetical protein
MTRIPSLFLILAGFVAVGAALPQSGSAQAQSVTAENVVERHLQSIGNPGVLAALKSRAFVGTASVNFIQGAHGSMKGASMFVSEGNKLGIALKYGDLAYPGEYFAYDGKDVSVGYISPGQRSPLADFLFRYNGLLKEGLFGGALGGGWPLLHLKEKQAKLKYQEATVEGRRLHELEYKPKKGIGDIKISLYFDPETFHHVRTEYRLRIRDDMSAAPGGEQSGRFVLREGLPDSIYVLVETFDDFKQTGSVTLPHRYGIDYSLEGQGPAFIGKWELRADQWAFDKPYDQQIFKAQK